MSASEARPRSRERAPRGKAGARRLGKIMAVVGSWLLSGCNALVDTSTEQCKTHADCTNKGGGFADTFCSADKICRPLSLPCTTSRDCSYRLGEPGYCRPDRVCTPVLTPDCTQVVPEDALSQDHVILAGFMGPVQGPFATHGTPLRQGAELALNEIETQMNGVPGADSGPQRHLAMLVCHDTPDDLNTLGRPMDVARHLVNTVRVPAIIGPSKIPTNVTDVITEVTSLGGVLTISPSATHPDIPALEKEGLFWRTVPSDDIQIDAWRYLSLGVVQTLWATGVVTEPQPPKIVYVARADSYGARIAQLFREVLPTPPPTWTYDLAKDVDWDSMADDIVKASPNMLFAFTTGEFVTKLLPRIEQRWTGTKRPYYLLLEGNRVDELLELVNGTPGLAERIVGTAPGVRTSPLFFAFRDRFKQAYGQEPGSLAEFAYDAAYLFAYAVAGAKSQRPSGLELARAMGGMSCRDGTRLEASPAAFASGFSAAAGAACVDFDGASGALNFDDAGQASNDYGVWCARRDPAGTTFPPLAGHQGAGVYFDVESPGVVGWPPDGFLDFCPAAP